MKKIFLALMIALSTNAFAQIQPTTTYDGGSLYFVPAKLTLDGIPFLYSYRSDYQQGKIWFTVFDDNLNIVKSVELDAEKISYSTRTVTTQRKFFLSAYASSQDEGYFLDEWTQTGDVTENKEYYNSEIKVLEVYEDNNNYHSRSMYLSQSLFNKDEDFEFLRSHYEIKPLTYCAADDTSDGIISTSKSDLTFKGEEFDDYSRDYDSERGGYVYTLTRTKVYGGLKNIGTDIVSLDGTVKSTLDGITSLGTVISLNGSYYVSAYDSQSQKYGLYKIATATTSLSKVAELTSKTGDNVTYNLSGIRVDANTKGIVVRNGQKILNK